MIKNEPFSSKPRRDFSLYTDHARLKRVMDKLAQNGRIRWDHELATKPADFDRLFGQYGGFEGVLVIQAVNSLDPYIQEAFTSFNLWAQEVDEGIWLVSTNEYRLYRFKTEHGLLTN